jgi:hypothetical protein
MSVVANSPSLEKEKIGAVFSKIPLNPPFSKGEV